MLIVMQRHHTPEQLEAVIDAVERMGFRAHVIPGAHTTAVGITGNAGSLDPRVFRALDGVEEALAVTRPYKLPSRDFHPEPSCVDLGRGVRIGNGHFAVMAGPCAVESEEQVLRIARAVARAGAHVLRGGAFKPRTSPYSFQGLGVDGLKMLAAAREETGLAVVTEATDPWALEQVVEYADVVQIGARNMQNFALLREAGRCDRPVMLKRGMSATLDEWLQAAEYIMAEGNENVVLCERGIRTFSITHTRNTLDLAAVCVLREVSHLPVVVDPSHGTGQRTMVRPMARAAAAIPADGIMVEVHDRPDEALSDGPQALLPDDFAGLMDDLRALASLGGYRL